MQWNILSSHRALRWVLVAIIGSAALFPAPRVAADIAEAEALVRDLQEQVRERMQQEGDALRSDLSGLYALVDELVVPHVDTRVMSRLVLGQHWKKAAEDQRTRFVEEFSGLMIRTYARSLLNLDQYQVEFLPSVPGKRAGMAMVRLELVSETDSSRLPISFRMRAKSGEWRVIDLIVNGISLITTYRESFGTQVRGGGLDPLIAKLKEDNANVDTQP